MDSIYRITKSKKYVTIYEPEPENLYLLTTAFKSCLAIYLNLDIAYTMLIIIAWGCVYDMVGLLLKAQGSIALYIGVIHVAPGKARLPFKITSRNG